MEFTAFPRSTQGSGASRRLRHAGKVPGIVYGVGTPTNIELDHNALFHALKNEKFHSSILTMKLEGKTDTVLLRDVQRHAFKHQVMHVDFQRIDANSKIHMRVPLHYVNADISPAVKISSAIISHVLSELDVACLPKDLPEFIEVDLSTLAVGQSIHVSDLKLPEGVAAVTRGTTNPAVATAIIPRVVAEVEEVAATTEAATTEAAAAGDEAKAGDKAADKGGDKGAAADKGSEKSSGKKDDKK
jgi:large subunit ribosomal protein L25